MELTFQTVGPAKAYKRQTCTWSVFTVFIDIVTLYGGLAAAMP